MLAEVPVFFFFLAGNIGTDGNTGISGLSGPKQHLYA